ncbi:MULTISPECIES: hypothetical protein [unclassified Bacillus (in: firmicutes)]|uniref:hypothetical protein n=1 Tax=unclassified Bacillus (in: firmicutes) TaxID=185979 RepID=UPI001BE8899C|nr:MULTISPECIES: hypothetical protein [unclassified Bacillus (in: firmicutes)]MBT2616254.1 hypothetical protein [Bacillus sp. ISL-78]MBT2632257.1 hypothetical protein [Bacillus sp. ISL-101]
MIDKIRRLFKKEELNEVDEERYVFVPVNEELQRNIIELEGLGEELGKVLQRKYANKFESKGKQDLRIWICRDIDGDEITDITSEKCLELEYRSQIAIDYNRPQYDEDFYADTIELWHFSDVIKGEAFGTIYNLTKCNLETEIEDVLKILLKD